MKNRCIYILLMVLPCGCAEIPHREHGQEMTLYEIKKNHPYGRVQKHHVRLTDGQVDELARSGITMNPDERTIVYYSMTTRRGRSEIEKAFLVTGEGEHGPFKLVVDIGRTLKIQEIHLVKNPIDCTGLSVIDRDFLEQFIGKNLTSSFEFASEPEDIPTTPAKIKPIKTAPITSEKIAKELRKWLVIAKILKRDYPIWSIDR